MRILPPWGARRSCTVVAALAAALAALAGPAWADHMSGHRAPTEPAPVLFADDFTPPVDAEYGWALGGFGGIARGAPISHIPVIFVHGNQADAQNFYVVRDHLKSAAGYTDQELWALSYGGLGYVGGSAPVSNDGGEAAYVQEHPQAGISGNPQANDVNVGDLLAFVAAVRAYTGSEHVQIVAHSLGVTIVRKAMLVDPTLRAQVTAVVAIAGANHGTTVCTGLEEDYYGCDEIAPGAAWLAELNAVGEAPGPTRWMTVYDGTGAGDAFYGPQDAQSPRLDGAEINREWPNTSHNDLRIDPEIVADYLDFLLAVEADVRAAGSGTVGQSGGSGGATLGSPEVLGGSATALAETGPPGPAPALGATLVLAGAGLAARRRSTRAAISP